MIKIGEASLPAVWPRVDYSAGRAVQLPPMFALKGKSERAVDRLQVRP